MVEIAAQRGNHPDDAALCELGQEEIERTAHVIGEFRGSEQAFQLVEYQHQPALSDHPRRGLLVFRRGALQRHTQRHRGQCRIGAELGNKLRLQVADGGKLRQGGRAQQRPGKPDKRVGRQFGRLNDQVSPGRDAADDAGCYEIG